MLWNSVCCTRELGAAGILRIRGLSGRVRSSLRGPATLLRQSSLPFSVGNWQSTACGSHPARFRPVTPSRITHEWRASVRFLLLTHWAAVPARPQRHSASTTAVCARLQTAPSSITHRATASGRSQAHCRFAPTVSARVCARPLPAPLPSPAAPMATSKSPSVFSCILCVGSCLLPGRFYTRLSPGLRVAARTVTAG